MGNLERYIAQLPKAELHLHLEGTFEPELMFKIAHRNQIPLSFTSVAELKAAYRFNNLQDFLDIYYTGASVLRTSEDFYDLTWAYLERAYDNRILHTEIAFDPQTHLPNGVTLQAMINGISKAQQDGFTKFGITSNLILSFLRHLDEASALSLLEEALPFREKIMTIGLDSSERGNPPAKFERLFEKARSYGFMIVAHAGEEGPGKNVRDAVELLNVNRIDHGNSCLEDEELVGLLRDQKIPLTLCPLSNLKLKVINRLEEHPIATMMQKGLMVTVNSDDPAYFGGYLNDNYLSLAQTLPLNRDQIFQIAKNSFLSSFLPEELRQKYLDLLLAYDQNYPEER